MSDSLHALDARDQLIVALDFPSAIPACKFLDSLHNAPPPKWVKVGLELFLVEGPSIVRRLRELGYSVFLDLKLLDIPNTVAAAILALDPLQVEMLTVHASGGPAMLRAAAKAAASLGRPPRLLAVTVLTSMDAPELASIGVHADTAEQVLRLARHAVEAGIRGLVASAQEAAMLRRELGEGVDLHLVTPGIRVAAATGTDDQQRIATPAAALRAGASQIVVGRPITRAHDPAAAYEAILAEMEGSRVLVP